MALPVSGAISFNNINVELGVAGTTQASLGQASYRTLAGVASGAISMSNFYGKANQFAFTISSNQTNANLRTLALNAGWNGTSKVVATINSGIYVSSNSTGTPALTVNGSFPGGVELINNGFIVGMGGNGGNGGSSSPTAGATGSSGGLALSVAVATTINNTGTIAGGGGGGGGGGGIAFLYSGLGGSGGGGGRSSNASNSSGGTGGAGSDGSKNGNNGGQGTVSAAGAGGARRTDSSAFSGAGGAGGGWGSSGGTGETSSGGAQMRSGGSGGAGGGAVSGNSNITYIATGTRLGAIT